MTPHYAQWKLPVPLAAELESFYPLLLSFPSANKSFKKTWWQQEKNLLSLRPKSTAITTKQINIILCNHVSGRRMLNKKFSIQCWRLIRKKRIMKGFDNKFSYQSTVYQVRGDFIQHQVVVRAPTERPLRKLHIELLYFVSWGILWAIYSYTGISITT